MICVSAVCLIILNGEESLAGFNSTNIVLIPKKKMSSSLRDYRPVSLYSVIYKVISKVLANRLQICLPSLISLGQSAFVQGGQIFDSVIAAFELLHSLNQKRTDKIAYTGLKLDMCKADDRIEWRFIVGVLRKLGFPEKWLRVVKNCLSTVSFSLGNLLERWFLLKAYGKGVPSRPACLFPTLRLFHLF